MIVVIVTVNFIKMADDKEKNQEIKSVQIVKSVGLTDYVLVLKDGNLSKILVADLKQSLK